MTRPADTDGWSTPALHGRGRIPAPPTSGDADPISAMLVADWAGDADPAWTDDPHGASWGTTTYVGPRRRRPRPEHGVPAPPVPSARPARPAPSTLAPPDRAPAPTHAAPAPVAPGGDPTASADAERSDRRLLSASRTMAVASLVSRITGFLRSALIVAALGTGIHGVGDQYNLGNNLPNMVYELLLGGVLSSVLVPLLVHAQEDDEDGGVGYAQRLLSLGVAALAVITVVAVACAPLLTAPFVPADQGRSLASEFATLLLPEIFFYGLGAMLMAVLNVRHSYGPGAWSSVLNNVVVIATVAVFWALPGPATLVPSSMTTAQVLVIGIGTTLGIAAQALVLVPALRRTGFGWQWRFRARPNEVGRLGQVGTLAGWLVVYVVASQIGVSVIAAVGVHHKAFTVFTQADLLVQMPYGILVVSLLTALMPRLSRAAARGNDADVVADLGLGARLSAVALVPVTLGLIVLGQALCIVLFAHGRVTVDVARLFGTALAASAFGLFPFALVMLQLRVFYAMRDGRTPTLINVFMVATKVIIVLVCARLFTDPAKIAVALTVATSSSYVIGALVGHVCVRRRLGHLGFADVLTTVLRVTLASIVGGAAAFGVLRASEALLGYGRAGALVALVAGGLVGAVVLGAVLWRMRLPEITDIVAQVRRTS